LYSGLPVPVLPVMPEPSRNAFSMPGPSDMAKNPMLCCSDA
jgi:hypothetical protein